MTQEELKLKSEKIKVKISEEFAYLSEEIQEEFNGIYLEIHKEDEKLAAVSNLYADIDTSANQLQMNGLENLIAISQCVSNSKVAFFIFHDLFLPKDVKKYLPFFNSFYRTRYTTIKDFLIDNGFSSIEEWEEYVRSYALDYQNNVVLKREQYCLH